MDTKPIHNFIEIAKKDSTDTTKTKSLESLTSLGGSQKGLADFVKSAGDYALGYVAAENKSAVEAILKREDVLRQKVSEKM